MPKFRKITGTHMRRENGKQVAYNPGSVIEATEEELRKHDPELKTWEKVDNKTPTTGNADGVKTKAEFLFQMEKQSKILHPELLGLGEMLDMEGELNVRTTRERDESGPLGLLALAERCLKTAIDRWNYNNDVQPVSKRRLGPPQSEEISRCEATIELIKMEIAYLQVRLKSKHIKDKARAEQLAKERKEQAEQFAYHPVFKDNPDAKKIREAAAGKIMRRKRATA